MCVSVCLHKENELGTQRESFLFLHKSQKWILKLKQKIHSYTFNFLSMKYNEKAWLFLILPFNNSAVEWFKAGDDNYLFTFLVNGVLIEMEAEMLELIQTGQHQVIHSIFCINHLSEKWPASQFPRNPYPEATFKQKTQCLYLVKHGGRKKKVQSTLSWKDFLFFKCKWNRCLKDREAGACLD